MAARRPIKLDPPVDAARDHVFGDPAAKMVLVEYGSYACPSCHAADQVVRTLRHHFGDRMLYVFRQRPISDSAQAKRAALLAEYAGEAADRFWPVHAALMERGPVFEADGLDRIAAEFELRPRGSADAAWQSAERRVKEDMRSARRSGAFVTPTFFINNRRYEGAWDESALAEAMLGSLGHRLHTATLDFVRWAPSAGLLLLVMSVLAIILTNSPASQTFEAWLQAPAGFHIGDLGFTMTLLDWVNHGLLTIFFLVVGLEIKREFSVGRLATRRAAALPVAASFGGIILPALIYLAVVPPGPLRIGWAVPIATDTAFAIAIIAGLGERVPVDLRVFLTAAVIIDDLVAIAVLALIYSGEIHLGYLAAAVAVVLMLMAFNQWGIYRALPYAGLGVALWVCLHASGIHATLAGVILAMVIPTRPPANLRALMAQAQTVLQAEAKSAERQSMWTGPSEPALEAMDAIHKQIESPASKTLRSVEPWSSYVVLPLFALANAGVVWSPAVTEGQARLMLAIILGLVVGKPLGILLASWLAVIFGIAAKPVEYTWRQLLGAGALAGIGFTMSLFIARQAFPSAEFEAAKIAIFAASLIAGGLGAAILWPKAETGEGPT